MASKTKLATLIDPELLARTQAVAEAEGLDVDFIVEEALRDLLEKRARSEPRPQVLAHYQASVGEFDELYKRLAQ